MMSGNSMQPETTRGKKVSFLFVVIFLVAAVSNADSATMATVDRCDRIFAIKPGDSSQCYKLAMELANEIAAEGVRTNDNELEARGLLRMALAELSFAKWTKGWEKYLERSDELTKGSATLGRAELLMVDGYIKAIYLGKCTQGIDRLELAIAVGKSLGNDKFLGNAFCRLHLVVAATSVDRRKWEQLLYRSIRFAELADDMHQEFWSRRQLLLAQRRFGMVDEENRIVVRRLAEELGTPTPTDALDNESRHLRQREIVEETLPELAEEQSDALQIRRLYRASASLLQHCREQREWDELERYLEIAKRAAQKNKNETELSNLVLYDAMLLAKDGRGKEALEILQPIVSCLEDVNAASRLILIYRDLEQHLHESGDHDVAAVCRDLKQRWKDEEMELGFHQLKLETVDYVDEILESRKIYDEVREKSGALDRAIFYSRLLLSVHELDFSVRFAFSFGIVDCSTNRFKAN